MNNRITKTMRAKAGFTLVELIVVIAILGILAGVGTVGYSGYIKKANMAADQTLLSSLNTAYAVACIENGVDAVETDAEDITISNGVVTADDIEVSSPAAKADVIQESFEKYYEGGTFKVMTALKFVGGVFVDADSSSNMFSSIFSGLDLGAYTTAFGKSTFSSIGSADLMTKVDDVTGLVAALFSSGKGSSLKTALFGDGTALRDALGLKDMDALLEYMDEHDAEMNDILANYAVLQVASTVSTKDTSAWLTELKNGMSADDIRGMMTSNDTDASQEGVAKAAMMYAMYTAYANQLDDSDVNKESALSNLQSIDAFAAAISDETQSGTSFYDYLTKEQATTDMEGFVAAMNIISSSMDGNSDATQNLLENGYNNTDLISALQTLLGN